MKKIFFVLFLCSSFFFLSTNAFAQSSDMNTNASGDDRAWINERYKEIFPYPITVGVYGFYDYSNLSYLGYDYYSGHGGGFSVNGKVSFFKWLAVALDISYSYTSNTETYTDSFLGYTYTVKESLGTFLFSPMVVFQRETPRNVAGLNSWGAIGFSIANNKHTNTRSTGNSLWSDSDSETSLGFILATGLRYNFANNIYVGGRFDWSYSKYDEINTNNVRLGVEVGYRF